jgi:type III pantothenate kinase
MAEKQITTLCIDFGNTRQKAALFIGNRQQQTFMLESNLHDSVKNILKDYRPDRSILSSVISHPDEIESLLKENTSFHLLKSGSKLPFSTSVGKPETIGADRLALCAAAVLIYPGCNNLVIGLGTAVTYNFINTNNEFLGGGISPGMNMRMKALNTYTARLPIVDPDWNVPLVGYDTKTNIQSGVVLGLANEIDGFIDAYRTKYRAFNALLTGGDLVHLAPHLKNLIFADPDLLFKGLYAISEINDQD